MARESKSADLCRRRAAAGGIDGSIDGSKIPSIPNSQILCIGSASKKLNTEHVTLWNFNHNG